jgi:FkbM family methyltransferase
MSAFEFEGRRFDVQGAATDVEYDASGKPTFRQVEILAKIRSLRYRGAVVDIGANTGNHSVFFSRFCEFSRIVAIEGPKDLCVVLRENARHNENPACPIEVVGAFVSCMRDLYLNEETKSLPGRWFLSEVPISPGSMPVRTLTLDELCRDIRNIDLIRIDADAHELEVLKSGEETLRRNRPDVWVEIPEGYIAHISCLLERWGYMMAEWSGTTVRFVHIGTLASGVLDMLRSSPKWLSTRTVWRWRRWMLRVSAARRRSRSRLLALSKRPVSASGGRTS